MFRSAALIVVTSSSVLANQALLLDVHYTHTSDNSARNRPFGAGDSLKGSHAYFPLASSQPTNFQSPIDYRHGQFAVVLDVLSKPSAQRMLWAGCAVQGNATCFGYISFTTTGRYVFTQNVSTFYQVDAIDWSRSFSSLPSIFRDENEKKLDLGEGFLHEPDYAAYYPLELRLRVYAVSAGASFVVPIDPVDAGLPDAGLSVDAGERLDAGLADGGASSPDAGSVSDAGVDAGGIAPVDAGGSHVEPADGGGLDAGGAMATAQPSALSAVEGGCASAPGPLVLGLALWVAGRRRAGSTRGR